MLAHIRIQLLSIALVITKCTITSNRLLLLIFGVGQLKQCAAKYNKLYKVACLDVLRYRLHY